jgi:hypothetical protein
MKTLALDLDSGRLARWVGDPRPFTGWHDRYGDRYTLRAHVFSSAGAKVPPCSLQLLIKRTQRRDAKALWSLASFSRVPSMIAPNFATYVGEVVVSGQSYRDALRLDAAPGNDLPKADFTAIFRAVTPQGITEAEFDYELINSGYRLNDSNIGALYVGLSENGSILVRGLDGPEWRELVVAGAGNSVTFSLGSSFLGPVDTLTLSDDFVRIQNGVLQIKNEDNNGWVNILVRGSGGSTLSLGDTPPVAFTLSNDRFKISNDGRLLLRNLTTGNWHEARVQLAGGINTLALGTEYDDSQV